MATKEVDKRPVSEVKHSFCVYKATLWQLASYASL